jgi:hypothetical protein
MHRRKTSPARPESQIPIDLAAMIQFVHKAAAALKLPRRAFRNLRLLGGRILRVRPVETSEKGRSARALAHELNIVQRKGMSPIRVWIEATLPGVESKRAVGSAPLSTFTRKTYRRHNSGNSPALAAVWLGAHVWPSA